MIGRDFVVTMARYNIWQNESLTSAASALTDEERERDRGAFFGSIRKTFSHLLWGDTVWLARFTGQPGPGGGIRDSVSLVTGWDEFLTRRAALDAAILDWAQGLQPGPLDGDLTWFSGALGREVARPRALLAVHMFNHQTHHRGQIHAMLTAAGARPQDTDLFALPAAYLAL